MRAQTHERPSTLSGVDGLLFFPACRRVIVFFSTRWNFWSYRRLNSRWARQRALKADGWVMAVPLARERLRVYSYYIVRQEVGRARYNANICAVTLWGKNRDRMGDRVGDCHVCYVVIEGHSRRH